MKIRRISALFLAVLLLAAISTPAFGDEKVEKEELHISTAEQLRDLAHKCTLDTYSAGLSVVLDNSIDLSDQPFYPIPTFSGTFDGCGYTISGLTLATDGSHQGLFRYVQAEGIVKRLKVSGTVAPEGSMNQVGGIVGTNYGELAKCVFTGNVVGLNYVGGIAGENYGTIRGCAMGGSVSAKRFTGGIAGINFGSMSGCDNSASINTSITAGGLELEKLSLSGIISTDLTNAEDTDVVSDTGGIVGFSKGTVQNCENTGTVGYQHYGYNVGGIAGRQAGYITDCTNKGDIFGRKDVGGIVGQMEPYKTIVDSMNLAAEIATLNYLINGAMNNLAANSGEIKGTLNSIQASASSAASKLPTENLPIPTPTPSGGTTDPATGGGTTDPTTGGGTTDPATGGGTTDPATGGGTTDPATGGGTTDPTAGTTAARLPAALSGGVMMLTAVMPQFELRPLSVDPSTDPSTEPVASPEPTPDGGASAGEDLSQMTEDFKTLNSQLDGSVGGLAGDLKAVSNQFSRVLSLMANALSGNANLDVFKDVSEKDAAIVNDGKVSNCINKGDVDADNNVGGVIGDMGIEYEFDLENELMGSVNEALGSGSIISNVYETRCVQQGNKNYGNVTAKKDNAGCVTGAAEMGLITNCEAYGGAKSTDGGYVGGIAGISNIKVVSSYAMCDLDGQEYVGGIVGYGNNVTDCCSLIGVGDVTACCGAIAGWADMTQKGISGNSFVHETLGAVDGISYGGIAEPMSYDEFMKLPLPEDFMNLKLSFVADGIVVKELSFSYGGAIDKGEIPAVPAKEGYTGVWPEYNYSQLYFSDIIEAVYTSRHATMAVDNMRGDSPMSIVLVEGDFEDGASVRINEFRDSGPANAGTVLEKWVLHISSPQKEDKGYSIRYLAPKVSKQGNKIDIYVLDNGEWTKADTGVYSSYLSFDASGDTVVFCAVEREGGMAVWIIIAIAAALAVLCVVILLHRKKKKAAAVPENETKQKEDAESKTDKETQPKC